MQPCKRQKLDPQTKSLAVSIHGWAMQEPEPEHEEGQIVFIDTLTQRNESYMPHVPHSPNYGYFRDILDADSASTSCSITCIVVGYAFENTHPTMKGTCYINQTSMVGGKEQPKGLYLDSAANPLLLVVSPLDHGSGNKAHTTADPGLFAVFESDCGLPSAFPIEQEFVFYRHEFRDCQPTAEARKRSWARKIQAIVAQIDDKSNESQLLGTEEFLRTKTAARLVEEDCGLPASGQGRSSRTPELLPLSSDPAGGMDDAVQHDQRPIHNFFECQQQIDDDGARKMLQSSDNVIPTTARLTMATARCLHDALVESKVVVSTKLQLPFLILMSYRIQGKELNQPDIRQAIIDVNQSLELGCPASDVWKERLRKQSSMVDGAQAEVQATEKVLCEAQEKVAKLQRELASATNEEFELEEVLLDNNAAYVLAAKGLRVLKRNRE